MQEITFTGNLGNNAAVNYILEEAKKPFWSFHKEQ